MSLCIGLPLFTWCLVLCLPMCLTIQANMSTCTSLSDYIRAGCPGMCVCVCVGDGELWLLYLCVYDVSLGVCVFAHIKV